MPSGGTERVPDRNGRRLSDVILVERAGGALELVKGKPSQPGKPGLDASGSVDSDDTAAVLAAAPSGSSTPPLALGIALLVLMAAGMSSSVLRRRSTR